MKKAKTIGIATLAVLVAVVVMQNVETATTTVLFWTVEMPRAVLLFLALLAGFLIGVLLTWRAGSARERGGKGSRA